jgi:hypothetical protein
LCVCSISEDTKGFYMRQATLRSSPPPLFHVLKNEYVRAKEQEKVTKTTFFAVVNNGSITLPLPDNSYNPFAPIRVAE